MYKCKASHGHNFANNIGEGGVKSIMPVFLGHTKCRFLIFLPLHHQFNCSKNISNFYLSRLNSLDKKVFLGRKNIGAGAFAPLLAPPYFHYVCSYLISAAKHV